MNLEEANGYKNAIMQRYGDHAKPQQYNDYLVALTAQHDLLCEAEAAYKQTYGYNVQFFQASNWEQVGNVSLSLQKTFTDHETALQVRSFFEQYFRQHGLNLKAETNYYADVLKLPDFLLVLR